MKLCPWLMALALVISQPLQAQNTSITNLLIPGPTSILLEIGRWIMADKDPVFEVKVQGAGSDETQAREQAFRLAVQQAVGALVVSQTEIQNQQLKRHEVLNYSSGYVDRFEVLGRGRDIQGRVTVDLRVWVRRSVIAQGLFGSPPASDTIDGSRVSAGLNSLREERAQSDAMLRAVLQQFPSKSFVTKILGSSWSMDPDRRYTLVLGLEINWHRPWIDGLLQLLETITSVPKSHGCNYDIGLCSRDNYSYVAMMLRQGNHGLRQIGAWQDSQKRKIIADLVDRGVMVQLSLVDKSNRVLDQRCFWPQQLSWQYNMDNWFNLMKPTNDGIIIYVYYKAIARLSVINLQENSINGLDKARIDLVPVQTCN